MERSANNCDSRNSRYEWRKLPECDLRWSYHDERSTVAHHSQQASDPFVGQLQTPKHHGNTNNTMESLGGYQIRRPDDWRGIDEHL